VSAVLEAIAELAEPAAAAVAIQRLNDRLATAPTIPDDIAAEVRELVAGVEETQLRRWEAIDPYHAVVVLHSAISAQRALERRQAPGARDQLRVALESIRQALAAIAEREPVADERTPKAIVASLAAWTEVPQARLAELLGVSSRQLQRWLSASERSQPEGEDARRVRVVARVVAQLRFALTPAGTVAWFDWPRHDLGGRRPRDLLGDPAQEPTLAMVAASMRSTLAA
jgi:uncharacterized protein (DUF2384 family)